MITRRRFLLTAVPATALMAAGARPALAQAARLDEKDPLAASLGYMHDATKVDTKKYPAYAAGHNCSNCLLFQGKSGEMWGACPAVGGKLVNAKGWCQAWAKKA